MSIAVRHECKDGQAPPEMYVVSSRLVVQDTLDKPREADLKMDSYVDELHRVVFSARELILEEIAAKKRPPTIRHRFADDDTYDVCVAYYKLDAATDPYAHLRALRDSASPIESWDLFLILHQTESRAFCDNAPEPEPKRKPKAPRSATPRRSKRRRLT